MESGNISSAEAFSILSRDADSFLIDVRTPEEWRNGKPSSCKNPIFFISWPIPPREKDIGIFKKSLESEIKNKKSKIFFICRSGARSSAAARAAFECGFEVLFNIRDGFEGSFAGPGWKNTNLPVNS